MAKRSNRKSTAEGVDRRTSGLRAQEPGWRQEWLFGPLLLVAVCLAYAPVWQAGFIWDDDTHLTANACIVGPKGLADVWTSSAAYYFPLTLTTWWFMHAVWGLTPLPYHLANVAMHGACAILLWRVLLRLRIPGAWLGAALWALHPVQVESVAWVSELINEQSGFFYLLAIWFYAKRWEGRSADESRRFNREYFLALLCALLALLSKPSTVMLPVVLGLVACWRGTRWSWREAAGLAPFFLLSVAMSGWTIWEQKYHSGASGAEWDQSWPQRIAIAGDDVWFYLGKLAWPSPLIFVYPRWEVDAATVVDYLPVMALAGALLGLWWQRKGPLRPVFFALGYFTVSLFPVLGFFSVYYFRYSFVADHFQYLASMGPLALAGAVITMRLDRWKKANPFLGPAVDGTILLVLGLLTWSQSTMYRDVDTLWQTTIARNPACWMAHYNLSLALLDKGQLADSMKESEETLRIKPDYAEAHLNLGLALFETGRYAEAMDQSNQALRLKPDFAEAHNNLGNALLQTDRAPEAITEYEQALKLKPDYLVAHYNLGVALFKTGRASQAIEQYELALKLRPDYSQAHNYLGLALAQTGETAKATEQFREAMRTKPDYAEASYNLATVLMMTHQLPEAIDQYRQTVTLKPDYVEAHYNLGLALEQTGRPTEAMEQYEQALEINPDLPLAREHLAQLQALQKTTPMKP